MSVDIKIIKLKVRRGTNAQRQRVVLDQGEVGFTTDTQRLFVGNGVLSGGIPAASKVFPTVSTITNATGLPAELGDLVFVQTQGKLYQLTNLPASDELSWTAVGTSTDDVYVGYDGGTLTVLDNSIDGTRLNQQSLSSETITFNTNALTINYNPSHFEVNSSTQFAIASGAITKSEISSLALDNDKGVAGGENTKVYIKVDDETISFDAQGRLTVIGESATVVKYTDLDRGFSINPSTNSVDTVVQGVSPPLTLVNGLATLLSGFSSMQELPMFSVNNSGLVNLTTTSIYDVLTGVADNDFKGRLDQGSPTLDGLTTFTVMSSFGGVGVNKSLTSAGFIVFQGNYGTRQRGDISLQPFAIPVFKFK